MGRLQLAQATSAVSLVGGWAGGSWREDADCAILGLRGAAPSSIRRSPSHTGSPSAAASYICRSLVVTHIHTGSPPDPAPCGISVTLAPCGISVTPAPCGIRVTPRGPITSLLPTLTSPSLYST